MNVALYRAGHDRWTMTERGHAGLSRAQNNIAIGPSSMHWDGVALRLQIDEWTAPFPTRVRGTVTLRPEAISERCYALDADGRHHWRPIAPRARVEARFDRGALAWSGDAYLDCNWGEEPLQRGFRSWRWSRAHTREGTQVYYDVSPRIGADLALALRFDRTGAASEIEPPPLTPLPDTFWRLPRAARGGGGEAPQLVRTLEDAPFYARSLLIGDIDGACADIMHESLSLDRFRAPIVQAMLPFRMPRIVGWG
jgi:carotenoid 1,2-hydratase